MRIVAWILFTLALIVAGLAVLAYLYAQGMSCAYALRGSGCRIRMPWELGKEDIILLIAIPWGIVLMLVVGGVAARRAGRQRS